MTWICVNDQFVFKLIKSKTNQTPYNKKIKLTPPLFDNRLKEDIKFLEKEKSRLDGEYNKVLKKNVELRKNNEEFQRKEIQQIINSIKNEEKNKDVKNENLKKIDDLQKKV